MDCKEFSNLLDAYLDGALTPEEAGRMEAHAAACADCLALLTLRKDCLALEEETELPEGFSSSWRQRIREEAKMERTPGKKKWIPALAAAAALVFILGGTALTRDRLPSAVRPKAAESAAAKSESAVYGKMTAAAGTSNVIYDDYDEAAEEPAEAIYDYAVGMAAAEAPRAAEAKRADAGEAASAREEKIIRTASFTIRTAAYDDDLARLTALVDQVGGRAEYMNTGGDAAMGQSRYAWMTLRIPTRRLDEFLDAARQIGSVTDMTEERQDVSDSYYDTQSRLDVQKEKLARLQKLMQSAESVSDLVEIESAAADAQYWIDRYTSQLKNYDSRVEYSTVSASLREVKATEIESVSLGRRIAEGLRDSLRGGVDFLKDALVFLAAALPWLAAAGAVAGLACWAVRRAKKKNH